MTRVFSGIKPTGHLTLGNYLGAMRRWVQVDQHRADALFCIVDLHALTVEHDPARVRRLSRQAARHTASLRCCPGWLRALSRMKWALASTGSTIAAGYFVAIASPAKTPAST